MRCVPWALAFLLTRGVLAQCPAIDFITVREVQLHDRFTATPLIRQSDGTYTAYPHDRFPPYRRRPGIPGFEESVIGCLPVTRGNTAPALSGAPAGMASRGVLAIADAGNNNPIGVWKQFSSNNLGVWQANPDLSFKVKADYAIGRYRDGVLSGDFNGDQRVDLLVLGARDQTGETVPGRVAFLRGRGDGTFDNAVFSEMTIPWPSSFAAADFNRDGRADLAVVSPNGSAAAILTGDGDGTFRQAQTLPVDSPRHIAAADVNQDSRPDLVIATEGSVVVFLANADSTFRRVERTTEMASNSRYIATADLNRDGRVDIIASGNSTVHVALGNGDGTFGASLGYVVGIDPHTVFAADVNRDGIPDIVVGDGLPEVITLGEESGTLSVLFGRGDGTFVAAPFYSGTDARAVASGDFNGDGRTDFATVGFQQSIVFLARADGGYATTRFTTNVPNGNLAPGTVAAADVNGDGRMDLVAGNRDGVWLLAGAGNGTFQAPSRLATTASEVRMIAAADLNGDRRVDLAAAFAGTSASSPSGVLVLLSQGTTFQPGVTLRAGTAPTSIAVADLNNDGRPDLAVADNGEFSSATVPGGVLVFLGTGNGAFGNPTTLPAGVNPGQIAVGDANGDRIPDLVVPTNGANFANYVGVLINQGPGTFRPVQLLTTDFGPSAVAIADFNGDSKNDLVIAHCCGDTDMTFMLGNGDGSFQQEVHFPGGPDPGAVFVSDLNQDSKPDLIILSTGSSGGGLGVFINNSPATPFSVANSAGFGRGSLAPASLASAFGTRLATASGQAESVELPTSLAGTTVVVRDSSGREQNAQLVAVFPTQVNFLVPADLALGRGKVTITAGDGFAQTADVYFDRVAPGVFTLNADGLAAAQIVRVAGGEQTVEDVYQVENGAVVPRTIPVGPTSNQLFLTLYTSGLRGRASIGGVRAWIRGSEYPVLYAGEQPQFPGLDQVNLQLPRLPGAGLVDIVVAVDLRVTNLVRLRFQ